MRTYRNIRPEEVAECKAKFDAAYPWGAEPRWEGVKVLVEDGEIIGFVGFQTRILVEPLYAESTSAAYALCYLADGSLQAVNEYEWFIPDNNLRMQHAVERQFGIEGFRELPGKIYQMNRSANAERKTTEGRGKNESGNAEADAKADAAGHATTSANVPADMAVCTDVDANGR